METVHDVILKRIPQTATRGQRVVIEKTLTASRELQDALGVIARRDELSPKGRAQLVEKQFAVTGAKLQRAQRQLDYHAAKLAKGRARAVEKAIGEPKSTDAEWRTYLRSMSESDRIQTVLKDPEARSAALRSPSLAKLSDDMNERALDVALAEHAGPEMRALEEAKEAHAGLTAAVRILRADLQKAPFIVEGDVGRPPHSPQELDFHLSNIPDVHENAKLIEEVEIDS